MDKYTELKKEFEIRRDSEKARQMAAYMRNIFSFYGIQTPIRRKIYKDFLKKEKKEVLLIGLCSISVIRMNIENFNISLWITLKRCNLF